MPTLLSCCALTGLLDECCIYYFLEEQLSSDLRLAQPGKLCALLEWFSNEDKLLSWQNWPDFLPFGGMKFLLDKGMMPMKSKRRNNE